MLWSWPFLSAGSVPRSYSRLDSVIAHSLTRIWSHGLITITPALYMVSTSISQSDSGVFFSRFLLYLLSALVIKVSSYYTWYLLTSICWSIEFINIPVSSLYSSTTLYTNLYSLYFFIIYPSIHSALISLSIQCGYWSYKRNVGVRPSTLVQTSVNL